MGKAEPFREGVSATDSYLGLETCNLSPEGWRKRTRGEGDNTKPVCMGLDDAECLLADRASRAEHGDADAAATICWDHECISQSRPAASAKPVRKSKEERIDAIEHSPVSGDERAAVFDARLPLQK